MKIGPRVALWMEMQLKPDRVMGGVPHAGIEPGALCNLRCPFCPTGVGAQPLSQEFLTPERFDVILDRLGPGLKTVRLYNWGESLLNPQIHVLAAKAAARGIAARIHTNFSLSNFDAEAAERLVDSGLDLLVVSCDGASQETYEQYRVGGRFDLVMRNVERILAARRRRGSNSPRVVWKFLLHSGNEHEKARARRLAKRLGIEIEFKNLIIPPDKQGVWPKTKPSRPGRVPARAPAEDYQTRGCLQAWDMPIIHSDGSVLPCCTPHGPEFVLGNIFQKPLAAIWNVPLVVAMRRYLKTGVVPRTRIPCLACEFNPHRPE
jgi:radical SAM protein with 4Fe4S-binding SPASM domain